MQIQQQKLTTKTNKNEKYQKRNSRTSDCSFGNKIWRQTLHNLVLEKKKDGVRK